ncbi:MAG: sulfatase [Lentisphaerae bacterium]|nr:sulfatase [Lentisphaerota bacterium]
MKAWVLCLFLAVAVSAAAAPRPNILWFVVDDMSADFGCYGQTLIRTPHVDRLAREGVRFTRAYITAPVCSPSRSAMITGMYQTTIGAHHHRSGRGQLKIHLPDGIEPVPALFRKAGYWTCIGSGLPGFDHRGVAVPAPKGKAAAADPKGRLGKTDYNFEWDASIYDGADWAGRGKDQPFFMQVQLHGGKLRADSLEGNRALAQRAREELGSAVDPTAVALPPYYPRDPVLLEDWAAYLDSVRLTDAHVGRVLERLEKEGMLESTLVLFMTDHGISHARGKQFLYDEGAHIPFVVRGPGLPRGAVREDLVEHLDMAALSLAAAGIPIPAGMQARDVFAKDYRPREAVFAARDRCDETVERIRSVRTDRYLYIRNFLPKRPHLQPNAYKDKKAIVVALRAAHAAGTLPEVSERLLFAPERPAEELYEYGKDRWQVTNLAADPAHRAALEDHRARLDRWIAESRDRGPESEAMYDSDMAEYLKRPNPDVERNIALMKRWAAEGK